MTMPSAFFASSTSSATENDSVRTADRARRLAALASFLPAIISRRRETDIVDETLRALHGALGFRRAVYLEIETTRTVVARRILDRGDHIEEITDVLEMRHHNAVERIAFNHAGPRFGDARDLDAPFVDSRAWWCAVPFRSNETTYGVVVADDPRTSTTDHEWLTAQAHLLAGLAALTFENARLLEATERLATRDALTGLFNRRAFGERLHDALDDFERAGRSFVLLMIDLDDFKRINDTRGHAIGDVVLQRLARSLIGSSRSGDTVGRFAGDEFVMLLRDLELGDVDGPLTRVLSGIRESGISCSLGAAVVRVGDDAESITVRADDALYTAKRNGKNRYDIAP